MVLGALLEKNGQDLADYGFPYFKLHPGTKLLECSHMAGFADDKERQAAFQKFKQWQQQQKPQDRQRTNHE